jgi:hypothetical protein
MVNQSTVAALTPRPISPDLACDVTAQQLKVIADHLQVVGLASQILSPGGVTTPVTNTNLSQLTSRVEVLEADVVALQNAQPQRRTVAIRSTLIDGSGTMDFTFAPAMPDVNYIIHVNLEGGDGNPADYFAWRVVAGSKTTTAFQIKFQNLPASTLGTIAIESLAP